MAVAPLQVHPDPDQALRDAVVQVARDPVPFGTHQLRLPGPGQLSPGPAELLVAAGQLLGMALRLGPARHRLPAQVLAMLEQPGVPQRRHDLVRHRLQDRHADPVRVSRMLRADQQRPDLAVIQPHRNAQHDRPRRAVADGHHLRRIRDPGGEGGRILRRGSARPCPGSRYQVTCDGTEEGRSPLVRTRLAHSASNSRPTASSTASQSATGPSAVTHSASDMARSPARARSRSRLVPRHCA